MRFYRRNESAKSLPVTLQPRSDTWPPLVARDTLFRAGKYHFATFRVKMEKYSSATQGSGREEWRQSVARHLFYDTRSYARGETLAQLISPY